MGKYLGLPIIFAFLLGYRYPFTALEMSSLAFYVLIAMMTLAYLNIKTQSLKETFRLKSEIAMGLFSLFLFTPLLQWHLSRILINDPSYFNGLYFAALCPVAIVAPDFVRRLGGNSALAFLLLILSTVLFPFTTIPLLKIFAHNSFDLKLTPIFIDMAILVFAPMVLAALMRRFLSGVMRPLTQYAMHLNLLAIALLAFVYFGSSISKLNVSYVPVKEIAFIILIIIFQDFGTYFLARWFFAKIFSRENTMALTICLAMKNLAMSGGILLFYDPKASLASAIGFFIHGLFFNYLLRNLSRAPAAA